jgi:hypothetical protein
LALTSAVSASITNGAGQWAILTFTYFGMDRA